MWSIHDNGRGFDLEDVLRGDSSHTGWGLLGIQERATLLGGYYEIDTEPGQGTQHPSTSPSDCGGRRCPRYDCCWLTIIKSCGAGLRMLFMAENDVEIVGEADSAEEALDAIDDFEARCGAYGRRYARYEWDRSNAPRQTSQPGTSRCWL